MHQMERQGGVPDSLEDGHQETLHVSLSLLVVLPGSTDTFTVEEVEEVLDIMAHPHVRV